MWVLYGTHTLENMVGQLVDLVGELEKAFSVENACRKLAHMAIGEVEDEASLALFGNSAKGIGVAMADAAAKKIATLAASRDYSVDSEIDAFSNKTSATRELCDAKARELVGHENVDPVEV